MCLIVCAIPWLAWFIHQYHLRNLRMHHFTHLALFVVHWHKYNPTTTNAPWRMMFSRHKMIFPLCFSSLVHETKCWINFYDNLLVLIFKIEFKNHVNIFYFILIFLMYNIWLQYFNLNLGSSQCYKFGK